MPQNPAILIIDDENNLRLTLALILEREGYSLYTAATIEEARKLLKESSLDLTILDLRLPDADGITFLPEIRASHPNMSVLILTAHDKLESAIEAVRLGARDYLLKPIDPSQIILRVKEVLAESNDPPSAREHNTKINALLKELHREENSD